MKPYPQTIATFATNDPFWQVCRLIFESYHRALGFDVHVLTVPRTRSWLQFCRSKPEVIRKFVRQYGDVIWMDCDCLLASPVHLEFRDVAYVPGQKRFLCSTAFLAFHHTPGTMQFLNAWCDRVARGGGDHWQASEIMRDNAAPECQFTDVSETVLVRQNEIKRYLRELPGHLPCPHCGTLYWDAFRFCTVATCKGCKKTIQADQWETK